MPPGKNQPDDIYSKQHRPRMGRRGRSGKRYRSSSPVSNEPRRHTGRFADGQIHASGLRMWAALGLIAMLVIYAGFLLFIRWSARRDTGPLMALPTPTPLVVAEAVALDPEATPAPPASESISDSLKRDIGEWARSSDLSQRARITTKTDDLAGTLELLTERLGVTPDLLILNREVARLHVKTGDYSNAVPVLLRAIAMDPTSLEMRTLLAMSLLKLRDYEGAEVVGVWNLELEPYSNELHQIIADSLLARGMLENALPHLRVIAETTPLDLKVQNQYANALSRAGRYERAVTIFSKLIQQDVNHALTYYNFAICHTRHGNFTAAIEILGNAADRLGPDFVRNWLANPELAPLQGASGYATFLETLKDPMQP